MSDLMSAAAPDVVPDWLLALEPCSCPCCAPPPESAGGPVGWAVPGVTGLDAAAPLAPPPSTQVQALIRAVETVERAAVPGDAAQALVDAEALLAVEQRLRVLDLQRVGDVAARGLHEHAGYRSAKTWLQTHRPDGDQRDVVLAERLRTYPTVGTSVRERRMSLRAAGQVTAALRRCARHLDRPDGLIDGQPGDAVVQAVLVHVAELLCSDLHGLADDDPRLAAIVARVQTELAASGTQAQRLEAALSWLGEELSASGLAPALERLVLAVLPSELDERERRGQARRGLRLQPLPDGDGWHLEGDLTLECGEMLWTALRAAATSDPDNPADTEAWAAARATAQAAGTPVPIDAWELFEQGPGSPTLLPRARAHRMHDAFALVLRRYLDAGLGGITGKAVVQIHVTVPEGFVTGRPGAMPPVTDSGQVVPRGLLRRWWNDSTITSYVLSLGGRALRVVHGQRTLTGDERRALAVEGGGRCVGNGCCPPRPDPLVVRIPHHVLGYAEDQITSLDETLPVCERLHHDLHTGKRTVRLRDGRWLNEHGFVDAPPADHPPF